MTISEKRMLSSVTPIYMVGTNWGYIKSNIFHQAEKQDIYQFISRQSLTEREMSQPCVTQKTGRKPWDAARKNPQFRVGLAWPAGLSLHLWTESGFTISGTHDDQSLSACQRMLLLRRARSIYLTGPLGGYLMLLQLFVVFISFHAALEWEPGVL